MAFAPARDTVAAAGIATAYLEARGEQVPGDPGERAAQMLTVFLASLWDGCTELSLDHERLRNALAVLEAETRGAEEADVLIAPLVGLRMPLPRLQLAARAADRPRRLDRGADRGDAQRGHGPRRLAAPVPRRRRAGRGHRQRRRGPAASCGELISVMHLFKAGSVGLGPYAFAPTGEERWARIATGAPATRPGSYELSEEEAIQLAEFAVTLEARPDPDGALAWAVDRFELGCGRDSALEGLSDHLLALRAVLDGHGPVGASLPMRASALIADESFDRIEARERIESALELERALMNGTPSTARPGDRRLDRGRRAPHPARNRPRRAQRRPQHGCRRDPDRHRPRRRRCRDRRGGRNRRAGGDRRPEEIPAAEEIAVSREVPRVEEIIAQNFEPPEEEHDMNQETRILEPIPDEGRDPHHRHTLARGGRGARDSTLDFPAIEGDVQHRERIDTPRVRHLFPVPEDADWEVRELKYDHYHHAG